MTEPGFGKWIWYEGRSGTPNRIFVPAFPQERKVPPEKLMRRSCISKVPERKL